MNEDKLFIALSKLYGDPNYFQENKHIIIMFVSYWLILFGICSYLYYLTNVESIRNNWLENRCKMYVIPFAGLINAPEGTSIHDYTRQNFTFCVQNMVKKFTEILLLPIQFIISTITIFFTQLAAAVDNLRDYINVLKQRMTNLVNEIYNRIVNVMVPFQIIFLKFTDIIGKMKGVLSSFMYSILGVYYTIKSTMGVILDFIIGILVTLTVLLAALITTYGVIAATAFINPAAAVMLPILMTMIMVYVVLFLSISIPSLIIVVFCMNYMNMQSKAFPSLPTCFDKKTNIKMNNHTHIPIYNIKPGDILHCDNRVEAIMKCLMTKSQKMYHLNNDMITSYHKVNDHQDHDNWIYVKDHPNSIEMIDYIPDYVFCMNTSKKTIHTHINKYLDWDESINEIDNTPFYRRGFQWDTPVVMKDKTCIPISNIKLGDWIYPDAYVVCIVIIDKGLSSYFNDECIWDANIDDYKEIYNFHLITSSSVFYIHDKTQCVNDYSELENYYL